MKDVMPKATFYNLPDEKKMTLIGALKTEFSRVPLFEASISNIVKEAGIPRGSFYQYFEDKEDAFFFLLNNLAEQEKNHFLSLLQTHDGDLFKTVIEFFERLLDEKEHFHFIKNALLHMTQQVERCFSQIITDNNQHSESFKKTVSLIDKTHLNISCEKDLLHVLNIITSIMFRNLAEAYAHSVSRQESLKHFKTELRLIQKGLVR